MNEFVFNKFCMRQVNASFIATEYIYFCMKKARNMSNICNMLTKGTNEIKFLS